MAVVAGIGVPVVDSIVVVPVYTCGKRHFVTGFI